ncbi:hypothetical protein [Thiobacillus denitrificans]|uniref:hypothetical protein n=1 Tax=Thiobacillus denitrificans TaxID=36861 RepID=UPI00056F5685|nr:hypothetical protein [Thiobacillus denitrificans]
MRNLRLALLPFGAIAELLLLATCWFLAMVNVPRAHKLTKWATTRLPGPSWYLGKVRNMFPVTVTYKTAKGVVESFVAKDVQDLDGSISGIEMDGGSVCFVTSRHGEKVLPDQLGSSQSMAW